MYLFKVDIYSIKGIKLKPVKVNQKKNELPDSRYPIWVFPKYNLVINKWRLFDSFNEGKATVFMTDKQNYASH